MKTSFELMADLDTYLRLRTQRMPDHEKDAYMLGYFRESLRQLLLASPEACHHLEKHVDHAHKNLVNYLESDQK